ncbi:bifunctional 4-hydroxy-2-oxoglutarate aldolase/2-dehydro-3-deoxy-phosphogluconate aldolase [Amycolatopsis mongoliensis]|uniref:Bifunctional 4-hydroxy-2-oxoglutarate aldolase/2-dehydro-3-deoxy-phosphogluconate aldolase n=1 Tax=Amycolatopsis mongoliensis TaxID=715475 RepID=A0A9Y2JLV8_9PSEU|nr:bifunctional 4-hydroxy-2-oxoglutarate aldolase/2-dehydro-3-deoxy-phosphogluconate aldolase [Amycolatopsis sp. 4-36]WIY00905.1 bifunctional 4-hydroxy-2-oxoglutarate aldolase/2-dehydro-3-deoxy-phosphogluconate aldolase [Amycolatopsis sp. 4-36]
MTGALLSRPSPSDALLRSGVVAILRAHSPVSLLPAARVLHDEGVGVLELTRTTPGALEALTTLRRELGEAADIGMGSVRGGDFARRCVEAGASFLVSPVFDAEVLRVGLAAGVPVYPAGMTPSELVTAWDAGAAAVKLFPASTVGPGHLKAVREPVPELRVMATGGIALEDVGAWLRAGALAVGLGGVLLGDALAGGDLDALAGRARWALGAAAGAR